MALSTFITALKVVPWGDVIAAAPAIVKGTRKLFSGTDEAASKVPPGADLNEHVRLLEERVQAMLEREQASAKLIAALAEQNAAVVEAIDVLHARMRWLAGANAALLALMVALAAFSAPLVGR